MPAENDLNHLVRQLTRQSADSLTPENPAGNSKIQEYMLDRSENDAVHISYQEEQTLFNQIRFGDLEALQTAHSLGSAGDLKRLGKMSDSPIKQLEYACCSFVTLAKCSSGSQILLLLEEAKFGFALAVHDLRRDRARISFLEQAKTYIMAHLNKDFTLDTMAEEIGINASYLSRKFKEYENIGIVEYTRRKRIQAAGNMLKYSDLSISAIAQYLCFHSQSYFGSIFKEYTGMSPRQYREQEKVTDFSAPQKGAYIPRSKS